MQLLGSQCPLGFIIFVLQLNFLKFDEDLDLVHKCRIKDVCAQLIPAFDSFTDSLLYLGMDAIDSRNTCC